MLKKFFLLFTLTCLHCSEKAHAEHMQTYNHPRDLMKTSFSLSSVQNAFYYTNDDDVIVNYFKNFEVLAKSENWEEIITQGLIALEAAKEAKRPSDEAKICAQLTSTSFYKGHYDQALVFATRCHELAEQFDDPSLFIRALYLESAIYRALAAKKGIDEQQVTYARAVEICEEAAHIYSQKAVENINLKGKIYFNLGAAHADHPQGDLEKAENCYLTAMDCFQDIKTIDDRVRTTLRLGKVYLLRNDYALCQQMIKEARSLLSSEKSKERLSMHADYLEAQLKLATNELEEALKIVKKGLEKAKILGAEGDESRLSSLLEKIENALALNKKSAN